MGHNTVLRSVVTVTTLKHSLPWILGGLPRRGDSLANDQVLEYWNIDVQQEHV